MSSLIEIQAQIEALQKQAQEIKATETKGVIEDIVAKMKAYDLTIEDLRLKSDKPAKTVSLNPAPAKYRGPNGEKWSGRGLMPKWMKALVDEGHQKEEYFIQVSQ